MSSLLKAQADRLKAFCEESGERPEDVIAEAIDWFLDRMETPPAPKPPRNTKGAVWHSPEKRALALSMFDRGVDIHVIADQLGMHPSSVRNWHKLWLERRFYVQPRMHAKKTGGRRQDPDRKAEVLQAFEEGRPSSEITETTGTPPSTVLYWRRKWKETGKF